MSGIDHPDVTPLMRQLQAFYGEVYGDGDVTPVVPADFRAPSGLFLVGYEDGVPVATGAWRAVDADPADPARRDGDAELKRMYVEPAARGRGHARTVLVALERAAAAAGRRRMILETGDPPVRCDRAVREQRIPSDQQVRRVPERPPLPVLRQTAAGVSLGTVTGETSGCVDRMTSASSPRPLR